MAANAIDDAGALRRRDVMEQQSKKTMRHFYCRDVLWETFEQMANDFDCSIDYLINEAMRFYAKSKNYQAGAASSTGLPAQPANGPSGTLPHRPERPPIRPRAYFGHPTARARAGPRL